MEGYVKIGKITSPFGYKGEVKIQLIYDFKEGFDYEAFFISHLEKPVPYFIEEIKKQAALQQFIIKFEDISSKEEARVLCGKEIFLPQDEIEIIEEEGDFSNLAGYTIIDTNHGEIGLVEDIYLLPHQEVAQVFYKKKEHLIPLHADYIIEIDKQNKEIKMSLPDGLLDL